MKFILGLKLGMSQVFDEKGNMIPVTLVEAGPCVITQVKTKEEDGYQAAQVGFLSKTKNIKKSAKGKEFKYIKEFNSEGEIKSGDKIDVSVFKEGEDITVSGISKGKGYAGAVKRWGFHGRSSTHGNKHDERRVGSIGCRWPQRVIRGKRMAGRMGSDRVTVKNLKIIKIDIENNLLAVEGAVPGRKGTLLEIKG
jgi:large subunit ribosomal protein L3